MTKRIQTVTSLIKKCNVFADVGCDHGYVSKNVLDEKLAKKVYITDVSKPSLEKAISLLSRFYPDNFTSFLTDGLDGVPEPDEVLIAGMGGEEIVKILKKCPYKPVILILQPMKNADKVRKYLHNEGYGLERDFMFFADGKYYEIMRAVLFYNDGYTEKEELYGRENLKGNSDFLVYLDKKISETEKLSLIGNLNEDSEKEISERLETLRGLRDEIKRNT